MKRKADYSPLPKIAERRILDADRAAGFGPEGSMPNRNRFYLYLTQSGSDVQVRTVAVKAKRRGDLPLVKEVALASVDDPQIFVRDLGFYQMGGYVVDWSQEGVGPVKYWNYEGSWESETWSLRCMWKIQAPVVNPELLKRTRRFRYSAWEPCHGHIQEYLKIYKEHPRIEFLAKSGLGQYCTKVSLIRKIKADGKFRQFFGRNVGAIQARSATVPEIMKAYSKGISLDDARLDIEARRRFRHCRLPCTVDAQKAVRYVEAKLIRSGEYTDYLHNCQQLGLDLGDSKVSFPDQFRDRCQIVQDAVDVIQAKADATKYLQMNKQLDALAQEWSWLEEKGRAFRILIPRTISEFTAEGRALRNCLDKNYAAKAARGDVLIAFVRQAGAPRTAFVAVEYDLKRGRVSQCYGSKNGKPEKRVLDFVDRTFKNVTDQLEEVA